MLARRDGTRITVLDKLTYAGNEANLAPVRDDPEMAARFAFVRGDIADPTVVAPLVADADAVLNFAAELHVDRSILDPEAFLATGVVGVHVLLEACRIAPGAPRFLQVSTDEVYGSVDEGHATEVDRLAPRSPYAAAKAAGELLVGSYVATHGVDAVVTRGSNTYGPYHHPEKLIPLFITNALDDQPLPLYGDGLQRREWLYVGDHAAGIDHVLRHGVSGETYNVAGGVGAHEPRGGDAAAGPARQAVVAGDAGRGPAGPRPALRDGWREARRPRLAAGHLLRGRAGGDGGLVPGERSVVARRPVGRLGRLVCAPVRRPARDRPGGGAVDRRSGRSRLMRVAVTGAGGRLGSALVAALADAPFTGAAGPIAWARDAFDLDAPEGIGERLDRDRPEVVVHAAAWTDVDGCALDPELAMRRNAVATGVARRRPAPRAGSTCWSSRPTRCSTGPARRPAVRTRRPGLTRQSLRGVEGRGRTARHGGLRGRPVSRRSGSPGRPGCSGRPAATTRAGSSMRPSVPGPPASRSARCRDEWGTPTYTADVAEAIVELLAEDATAGIHHLVNGLFATRADWARYVVGRAGLEVEVVDVPASTWTRPSRPPRWGVLAPTPLPSGEPMRPWPDAMADYAPALLRASRAADPRVSRA